MLQAITIKHLSHPNGTSIKNRQLPKVRASKSCKMARKWKIINSSLCCLLYADWESNICRRLTAGETLLNMFRAVLAFLLAIFSEEVSLIGPGETPFFSALPLGVTEGGSLKFYGGKGPSVWLPYP